MSSAPPPPPNCLPLPTKSPYTVDPLYKCRLAYNSILIFFYSLTLRILSQSVSQKKAQKLRYNSSESLKLQHEMHILVR